LQDAEEWATREFQSVSGNLLIKSEPVMSYLFIAKLMNKKPGIFRECRSSVHFNSRLFVNFGKTLAELKFSNFICFEIFNYFWSDKIYASSFLWNGKPRFIQSVSVTRGVNILSTIRKEGNIKLQIQTK